MESSARPSLVTVTTARSPPSGGEVSITTLVVRATGSSRRRYSREARNGEVAHGGSADSRYALNSSKGIRPEGSSVGNWSHTGATFGLGSGVSVADGAAVTVGDGSVAAWVPARGWLAQAEEGSTTKTRAMAICRRCTIHLRVDGRD